MRRAAFLSFAALLCLASSSIDAQQVDVRADGNANYTLSARLDPDTRTLTGVGRITWRNRTATPTATLRLHLYWNAWRDLDSTWMREMALEGDTSLAWRPARDRSAIDLTALRLADTTTDLLPRLTFVAPDDGNARDRTLAELALDTPVDPGESIALDVAWTARVPRTFARTGVLDRDYVVAHWFPKIGVLDDRGWRASQFHASTEFFADFGTYDVGLTVPTGWIVGATGIERARDVHDNGTTTHRYRAEDVHDFAWATSPEFIVHERRVDVAADRAIDVRLLIRPEHAPQATRHLEAARDVLVALDRRLGPFPWPQLTIVDPATIVNPRAQGESTGGMEYPMFIMAGTHWSNPWVDDALEDVLAHEITHQYFQSAVATDEVRDAWLDEGVTTWVSDELIDAIWPTRFVAVDRYFGGLVAWRYPQIRWSRPHLGFSLDTYRVEPGWDAPTTETWRQSPRTLAHTNYLRAPLALETLRRTIGDDAMTRAIATFAARGRFRHPGPADFTAAVNDSAGRDMTWLLDATLGRPDTFDYAVDDVVTSEDQAGDRVESTVFLRRLAPGVFPVDVHVTFDDGREVVESWDGAAPWHALRYDEAARVTRVEIDPARVLVLDVHRTNNSWTATPRAADAAHRWTPRWVAWLQHVLLTYGFFV